MTISQLTSLKQRVEQLQQETSRATGGLEQVMLQLKNEFGCDSLEEAQEELTRLEADVEASERTFREDMARFEKEYGDRT